MELAKVLTNGMKRTIALPDDWQSDQDEILINRVGDMIMLLPKDDPWAPMIQAMGKFTEDCLIEEIQDLPMQERNEL